MGEDQRYPKDELDLPTLSLNSPTKDDINFYAQRLDKIIHKVVNSLVVSYREQNRLATLSRTDPSPAATL